MTVTIVVKKGGLNNVQEYDYLRAGDAKFRSKKVGQLWLLTVSHRIVYD